MTRKADDEYFLKSIPIIAEHVEVIYPPGLTQMRLVKEQLALYLQEHEKHRTRLLMWSLILPADFYLAKFFVMSANLFFCYNVFRINAHWRAYRSASTLQKLLNHREGITWTPSEEFEKLILDKAEDASGELGGRWRYLPERNKDLHDLAVEKMEKDMRLVELGRTYRRVRAQFYFRDLMGVKGKKEKVVKE
ncbi:hypothetical protein HDU97_000232 [Phlyctochytrium planicorne]|nr:hypothetical protein HDU97_000232 [Phlyctochytrium planicorne]